MNTLWAITGYFNPLRWKSRLENYRLFRECLGVPLLTVEWEPDGRFELAEGDADELIRVAGGDLMWQKERLLNIGLGRLPAEAEYVAWLDCDILFLEPRWPDLAVRALDESLTVQLFSDAYYLTPEQTSHRLGARGGSVFFPDRELLGLRRMASSARVLSRTEKGELVGDFERNPGIAWAARRETIERVGLYDRAIVGGGDFFWLLGVLGRAEEWLSGRMEDCSYLAESGYPRWADAAHGEIEGSIGFIEGKLVHLDHGEFEKRDYKGRHLTFNRLSIDIERDIASTAGGAWAFVDPKPEWTDFMSRYFLDRQEDRA